MLNNNRIGYLQFWCQKVLPLVYDNSLSYYEVLLKVRNKLNEVIKYTNEIPDYIDKKVIEAFDDEHLKELISEVFRTIEDAIATNNEGTNTHFSSDYPGVGTLIWHDNKLYETMHPIDEGDAIIPNSNIKLVNFGDMFTEFLGEVKTRFTDNDDGLRETSSADRPVHDLVWLNNSLYEVIKPIAEGNAYIYSGTNKNVETTNLDKIYDYLLDLISSEINAREEADDALQDNIDAEADTRERADNTLQDNIDAEAHDREVVDGLLQDNIDGEANARETADNNIKTTIGELSNLQTANKTSVVNAINSIVAAISEKDYVCPEDFGAVGDGVTDDTDAVQACILDGRPVRFINNYAVTKIHFTYGLSTRFLDGNDNYIIALDKTKSPVEFCGGGALIYRLGIRQHGEIGEAPALYWYSENGGASNFNIFYDLRFDYCYHCIKYGDGSEVAQSENRIIGMFTYACSQFITTHGRLLQLWVDQAVLNASQFPSSGNMAPMINVTRGSILFIDNSTIENVGYEQQSGIVSTGECYINNCVLEIAGVNLACFREANGVDNDGLISMTNSRAYQGGVAKDFLDIAMGGNCVIQNCYILKLTPANLFFYHNPTSETRLTLQGVKCTGGILPNGNFPNLMLSIENSTFDNLKRYTGGYMIINNTNIPSPTGELPIWDNTVYGNYEAVINNINSSSYVGTTGNYLLLAGGTVGNFKGAFIYTAPNHSVGILNNYMTEYGSTITGGISYT